jgi:hypothetical protein
MLRMTHFGAISFLAESISSVATRNAACTIDRSSVIALAPMPFTSTTFALMMTSTPLAGEAGRTNDAPDGSF